MQSKNISRTILIAIFSFSILLSGCDFINQFLNPFTGNWKAGIFTLEFNDDNTFILKTGLGFTIESEGTYNYDENTLFLDFSEDTKAEFTYEFNNDKTELSILPKSESDLFKAKIKFEKQKE